MSNSPSLPPADPRNTRTQEHSQSRILGHWSLIVSLGFFLFLMAKPRSFLRLIEKLASFLWMGETKIFLFVKKLTIQPRPPKLPIVHSGSTSENFRKAIEEIDLDNCEENGEKAFYVCDLASPYRLYLRWQRALGGRVEPFYAVKCNPDPHVLHLFVKLGLGFDCASHAEIATVLALGASPDQVIFANPCKASSFIRYACTSGVDRMTFDNVDELVKVAKYHPRAKMLLRILTDDRGSLHPLGCKFGAPLEQVGTLLAAACQLGVNVVGVAFHVGSGCTEPVRYIQALRNSKWVFDVARQYGFNFDHLDVGGGFKDTNFEALAEGLLAGLDEFFPLECGVRVVAEPGRYFVTEGFELATNIIARRPPSFAQSSPEEFPMVGMGNHEEGPATLYYINDGIHGAFMCKLLDANLASPKVLTLRGKFFSPENLVDSSPDNPETESESKSSFASLELEDCKIFGPSCSPDDLVCPRARLPTKELKVGDWLGWAGMGAYSVALASQFNGFKISQVRYTIDSKGDQALEDHLRLTLGCVC